MNGKIEILGIEYEDEEDYFKVNLNCDEKRLEEMYNYFLSNISNFNIHLNFSGFDFLYRFRFIKGGYNETEFKNKYKNFLLHDLNKSIFYKMLEEKGVIIKLLKVNVNNVNTEVKRILRTYGHLDFVLNKKTLDKILKHNKDIFLYNDLSLLIRRLHSYINVLSTTQHNSEVITEVGNILFILDAMKDVTYKFTIYENVDSDIYYTFSFVRVSELPVYDLEFHNDKIIVINRFRNSSYEFTYNNDNLRDLIYALTVLKIKNLYVMPRIIA